MSAIYGVGATFGDGPLYKIDFYGATTDGRRHFSNCQLFEGDRAYSKAHDSFEEAKLRPEIVGLWFLRLDAAEWKFVAPPIERTASGDWGAWDDHSELNVEE
ncbi:MAG TPA: hypothetical protein VKE40_08775 [Gemmataceae bacterium]|nr:hypothetical protein [Gemmataceae bacterium]